MANYDSAILDYALRQREQRRAAYQQEQERGERITEELYKERLHKEDQQFERQGQLIDIAGRRQLAYDQYGYNYGLQAQQGQIQAERDAAAFQHADELFEREKAGKIAEIHLQQIQEEKMLKMKAGIEEQQDQAKMIHETNLLGMRLRGEQARDRLLQLYRQGELAQEHVWKAEELEKEDQVKQQIAWRTHVAQGIQNGNFTYDKGQIAQRDKILEAIQHTRNTKQLTPEDRRQKLQDMHEDLWDILDNPRIVFPDEKAASLATKQQAIFNALPPKLKQLGGGPGMVQFDAHGKPFLIGEKAINEQMKQDEERQKEQFKVQHPAGKTAGFGVQEAMKSWHDWRTTAIKAVNDRNMSAGTKENPEPFTFNEEEEFKKWQQNMQRIQEMTSPQGQQQRVGGHALAQPTIQPLPGQQQPTPSNMPQQMKPGIGSTLPTISSEEEYDKLPSGTIFIGPDGKKRRKP
jgi:hypothetical protein